MGGMSPRSRAGTNATGVPVAASGSPSGQMVPFGVPLAPPIYFVNFLFLYFSNPATAALMPAYRVPLPQQVYKCLLENPDGCPYDQMARFFRQQATDRSQSKRQYGSGRSSCQTTPRWQTLAPPVYQHPDQINEPLGNEKADQLAQALGIEQDMILTDTEYQCVMGVPPRDPAQEILYACFIDFTASKGNGIVVPFSSYGLNLNEQGNVLSLCAPHAPCLEANKVFLRFEGDCRCVWIHEQVRAFVKPNTGSPVHRGRRGLPARSGTFVHRRNRLARECLMTGSRPRLIADPDQTPRSDRQRGLRRAPGAGLAGRTAVFDAPVCQRRAGSAASSTKLTAPWMRSGWPEQQPVE